MIHTIHTFIYHAGGINKIVVDVRDADLHHCYHPSVQPGKDYVNQGANPAGSKGNMPLIFKAGSQLQCQYGRLKARPAMQLTTRYPEKMRTRTNSQESSPDTGFQIRHHNPCQKFPVP